MTVADVMTKDVGTCAPDQLLNEAARVMWERDCGVVPIVLGGDSRQVVGVITDRDICMAVYTKGRSLSEISIGEVMSTKVASCTGADDVSAAEATMQRSQVHRLPVVDDSEQLVGIISLADIARASTRRSRGAKSDVSPLEVGETLAAIRRSRQLVAAATGNA
jgi:CBS domain-containing protein